MRPNMVKSTDPLKFETICRISHDLRKQGKTIGFTHGAFDLFHYGHLMFLRESAKKCDFLIVGIDSDQNIKKYKSYSRPIIEESRRLDLVAELQCVGAAFVNDVGIDDVWIEMGKELRPDILTMGPAYGMSQEKLMKEVHQVKTKLVQLDTQYETTSRLIRRIINTHKKLHPNRYGQKH